ncbi:hypothetical protein ACMD2_25279 [Ananas comosus]|uniref:Uncharacterized protein n=1 Tax=Ananas comosus TaxID=4615 RepID=A0A199UZP2_ANACO|nr:hypothetical protein ACMD2_25279 [Ananas comosus]
MVFSEFHATAAERPHNGPPSLVVHSLFSYHTYPLIFNKLDGSNSLLGKLLLKFLSLKTIESLNHQLM